MILDDTVYMKRALTAAHEALKLNEVPIGAVVIAANGTELGCGYNIVESSVSQSRHAEIIAIEKAGKKQNNWRLAGCSLYVTIQPCLMCLGLICLSRIERLVWGAPSQKFGCPIDNMLIPQLYLKHIKEMKQNVMQDEALQLVQQFFKQRR